MDASSELRARLLEGLVVPAHPLALTAERRLDERRRARMLLAIIEHVTRNFGEAERLVKEALSLQPGPEDQPKLLFVLGRTYLSSGRQAEGVATFEVIVREYPQSPAAAKARESLVNLRQR